LRASRVRKTYRHGTHRSMTPADTLARVWPFMPVMGITRIANVTGLDCIGIPVVMVVRPNSRSIAVSQGKSADLTAAKASGVMESVETYHAEHMILPLKLGSYEEMRYRHPVADVAQLPFVARSRFRPDLRLLWVEGHDLLRDEPVWVPYELVHTDYTLPPPSGSGCFVASSNGLASGNHLLEAISHGICEVVERDAATIWTRRPKDEQARTRIDLASIDSEECQDVLARYERAGIAVAVWEMTGDIGIPSFMCMIAEPPGQVFPIPSSRGMGCHASREIALLRALTEAAQSRLTIISGSRDDLSRKWYDLETSPDIVQNDWSRMQVQGPLRRFKDAPTFEGETLDDDVEWELERQRAGGIDRVATVDLTRPEFNLPVARVVIPGLEGSALHPGYAPGARARAVFGKRP
jgi:ribosomal protein S12 methylthiotransferase accessory factor